MSERNELENLLKGCIAGDRQAQEGLYRVFHAAMLRLCYRYLQTDMLAEEALNTGFLKVFTHIAEFDADKGELAAWIKTIMIRNSIDLLRREAKFVKTGDARDADEPFIDPEVLSKLFAEDLLRNVRQLPAATRLVFNLSVIEGYSHKEIAEQLSIGESTSRWHLAEAKKLLREALTDTKGFSASRNQKEGRAT